MDQKTIVEKLASALHVFGKADVLIRFENKPLLNRLDTVSRALESINEIDLKQYVITIIPQTEQELSKDQ
jgi:hypothetical protein